MTHHAPVVAAAMAATLFAISLRPGPWGGLVFIAAYLSLAALHRAPSRASSTSSAFLIALGPFSVAFTPLAPVSVAAAALASALLAAVWALVAQLAIHAHRSRWRVAVSVSSAWLGLEYLAGHPQVLGPLALPFVSVGSALADGGLRTMAAILGPLGLTTLVWFVAGVAYVLAGNTGGVRRASAYGLLLVLSIAATPALVRSAPTESSMSGGRNRFRIRVVQHDPSPVDIATTRLDPAAAAEHAEVLAFRTSPAAQAERLTLWPEASLIEPWDVGLPPPAWLPDDGAVLLGGAVIEGGVVRNAALLWQAPSLTVVGEKVRTVPWVERSLAEGRTYPPFTWRGTHVATLSCYEVLFPSRVRQAHDAGADVIVVLANDAYAASSSVPGLHLRMARLRATEVGLPIVFVQATGPSAVLDPRGHIVVATKHGVVDVLDADVRLERAATVTPSVSSSIGPLALLISLVMRIPFQRRWLTRREVSPMS